MRDPNKYQTMSELVEAVRVELAKVEVLVLSRELGISFKDE